MTREGLNTELNRIWRQHRPTVVLVTHSIAEAVFLGTRVLVMSPRPGRLLRNFDVDLPTERDYAAVMSDPRFERLAGQIRANLRPFWNRVPVVDAWVHTPPHRSEAEAQTEEVQLVAQ